MPTPAPGRLLGTQHLFRIASHSKTFTAVAVLQLVEQGTVLLDDTVAMRRVAEGESFVVTVNGRAVADVVPHRQDTGRRRFVPVSELAEAFAADAPDPAAWQADLTAADEIFGPDDPADPFGPETR